MSPSYLESGQLEEQKESKAENKNIFNATGKPSKSMDLNNLGEDGKTGLPEHDDEILRQLNQMTQDLLNEERTSNLYLL